MASFLASIYGTEQDKVNCSFYFKIGACRHGDRCSRKHVKPSYSQTILCPNLYQNPAHDQQNQLRNILILFMKICMQSFLSYKRSKNDPPFNPEVFKDSNVHIETQPLKR
ncbi:hypothetical protein PCK1_000891 [Pneumocystis canis]|nr:hypothetical protein PCK1_000891 [Pneumocystis canis]